MRQNSAPVVAGGLERADTATSRSQAVADPGSSPPMGLCRGREAGGLAGHAALTYAGDDGRAQHSAAHLRHRHVGFTISRASSGKARQLARRRGLASADSVTATPAARPWAFGLAVRNSSPQGRACGADRERAAVWLAKQTPRSTGRPRHAAPGTEVGKYQRARQGQSRAHELMAAAGADGGWRRHFRILASSDAYATGEAFLFALHEMSGSSDRRGNPARRRVSAAHRRIYGWLLVCEKPRDEDPAVF